jgi:hypothetical protein
MDIATFYIGIHQQGCFDVYFVCPKCSRINYCGSHDDPPTEIACDVKNVYLSHAFDEYYKKNYNVQIARKENDYDSDKDYDSDYDEPDPKFKYVSDFINSNTHENPYCKQTLATLFDDDGMICDYKCIIDNNRIINSSNKHNYTTCELNKIKDVEKRINDRVGYDDMLWVVEMD